MNTELNEKLKQYQRNYYASKEIKKIICFCCINMSKQILKFGDFTVNKIEFHAYKQVLANLVNTTKIVVSDKFKHSDDGLKYFIVYLHDDDVIRPL